LVLLTLFVLALYSFVSIIHVLDGANESIVEIFVDNFDVGVEFLDCAEDRGQVFGVQTAVKLVIGEEMLKKLGKHSCKMLITYRSFLKTDAVHEIDDVY